MRLGRKVSIRYDCVCLNIEPKYGTASHVFRADNMRVALNADEHGMDTAQAHIVGLVDALPVGMADDGV